MKKFGREYLDVGGMKKQEAGKDYITINALIICFTWHRETWILHF